MKKPKPQVPDTTAPESEVQRLSHLSLKIDRLYMRHAELTHRPKRIQAERDEMEALALEMIPLEKHWNESIPQGLPFARYKIRVQR